MHSLPNISSDGPLRILLDSAPDAIAIVQGPVMVYINPTGASMMGHDSPKDLIGMSMAEWLHPDDAPIAGKRIGAMMRMQERHSMLQEYRAFRKDGTAMVAEVSSVPIRYQGKPAVLAFVRDVTARKCLEQKLALTERLASLGQLSAGVAHELNNPLTHMALSVESLRRLSKTADPGDQPAALEAISAGLSQIAGEIERMSSITRELQLFASPQPRKQSAIDVRRPLELALSNCPCPTGIELVRDFDPAAHKGIGDISRLTQVFGNLLRNAFDALVESQVATPKVVVRIRDCENQRIAIEVRDNGPGIPSDVVGEIFEPFVTTKRYGKGIGLGLAISRSIVEAGGGTLAAESTVGEGAVFTVTLASQPDHQESDEAIGADSLRILVIDDEPGIRNGIRSLLEPNHKVVVVDGGPDALKALEQDSGYDVILCDVKMPNMTGPQMFERLLDIQPALASRVLFMTGSILGEVPTTDQARSHRIVRKPFTLDELELELHRVAAQPRS